jgi:iron(III) transport system permease protein
VVTTAPYLTGVKTKINPWTLATILLCVIFIGPIVAVFIAATGDSGDLWTHLFETVLPRYVSNTLILMAGVAVFSLLFGVPTAWIVTRYEFPFRRLIEWMLLLPAAVPAYIIAYTYTDFLEYAGPVQGALRDLFGWESARDYWFPEIRSMGGAMLVMGAVLYPYVYMMARSAFILTPASLYEVGQLYKRDLFRNVALPLARPAIVAGLALAMMETISDFGTVEYFAVETLTLGIFNVWLGMNSLSAAAQISCIAFIFIIVFIVLEKMARQHRRYNDTSKRTVSLRPEKRRGLGGVTCLIICATPIAIGFIIPVAVLLNFVLQGHSLALSGAVISAAFNTLLLSATVAILVICTAAFMVLVFTYQGGRKLRLLVGLASIGYAFPGTILAIGVVTAGGAVDSGVATMLEAIFGLSYEGWLTSGIGLIVVACAIRFQAVGYGAMTSGMERLPPNMMNASRVMGRSFGYSLKAIIMPLVKVPVLAGGLLVFIDVTKELPMTLLLRPFNYETLATYVYQFAKDELLEEAALPALIIIVVGVLPVIVMNAAIRRSIKH